MKDRVLRTYQSHIEWNGCDIVDLSHRQCYQRGAPLGDMSGRGLKSS